MSTFMKETDETMEVNGTRHNLSPVEWETIFIFSFEFFSGGGREMLFTTRPQGAAIYESTAHTKLKRRKRNETAACVFGGREKHRHYSHLLLLLTALLHLPTPRCLLKVKYVSSLRLKVKYSTRVSSLFRLDGFWHWKLRFCSRIVLSTPV